MPSRAAKLVVRPPDVPFEHGGAVDTDRTYSHILAEVTGPERFDRPESQRTVVLRDRLVQQPAATREHRE